MKQLIAQGAEAKIFLVSKAEQSKKTSRTEQEEYLEKNKYKLINNSYLGGRVGIGNEKIFSSSQRFILKNRLPKSYRIKELDEKIRKIRTRSESKILQKAIKITNVPKVIKIEKFDLELEYIEGDTLSEKLNSYPEKKQLEVMSILGKEVSKLHDEGIIHGDLTTSNTILVEENSKEKQNQIAKKSKAENQLINTNLPLGKSKDSNEMQNSRAHPSETYNIFIIDFGLSFISHRLEDKAVDLHLIKQALEAKHYQNHQELYKAFLEGYTPKDKSLILEQLKKVESRGRYKH